jgi:ElaB/YqjD/DUF883 family membrane-anchored ribosome-binding protein
MEATMTDFSNNGFGASDSPPPTPKPKTARKPAAPASTSQQDSMTDDFTTPTANASFAESEESSRLRATLQKIEARADELRRWGSARQEMAREVVEERPLVVIGAAFGVGLLIGLLSARI